MIGCDCAVCTSANPKNNRLRSSVVVRAGETTVLVDSGPDLRMQALREGLREIDAVIYTHSHLDHVAGFDELRAFCWRKREPLPMHATAQCMATLVKMFGWAFSPENLIRGYVRPDSRVIDGPFHHGHLKISPLPVEHAGVETLGYLFEYPGARSVAYLSDVKRIPDETMKMLRGVDVLVIDALRVEDHPTHFCLAESLAAIEEAGAGEAWLTHLSHEFDSETLESALPGHIHVAWDGLRISL